MNKPLLMLSFALWVGACTKPEPPREDAPPTGRDIPQRDPSTPASEYKLTPSEVPLSEDFNGAADKRVTPDTYKQELGTIERELDQLKGDGTSALPRDGSAVTAQHSGPAARP